MKKCLLLGAHNYTGRSIPVTRRPRSEVAAQEIDQVSEMTDHDTLTCMACRQAAKADAERMAAVEELIKEIDEVRRMAPFPIAGSVDRMGVTLDPRNAFLPTNFRGLSR